MTLDEMIAKKEKLMEEYQKLPVYSAPTKVADREDDTYFVCQKCKAEVPHNITYVKNYGGDSNITTGEAMAMNCEACGYAHYERIE